MASADDENALVVPPYPSVLHNIGKELDRYLLQRFKKKLEKELSTEEIEGDRARCLCWLSFIAWHSGEKHIAVAHNKDAMRARANVQLETDEKIMDSKIEYEALKELALFYSTLSPKFQLKAIELWELIETYNDADDLQMIAYSLGRSYRQLVSLHTNNDVIRELITKSSIKTVKAIQLRDEGLFTMISWVNLAQLVEIANKHKIPNTVFPEEIRQLTQIEMLENVRTKVRETRDWSTLVGCGVIYFQLEMYDDALEMLNKAINNEKTSKAHHYLARSLQSKIIGNNGTSRDFKQTRLILQEAWRHNRDTMSAIEFHFKRAIALVGENITARLDFGKHLRYINKTDQAVSVLTEVLSDENVLSNWLCARTYDELSYCYQELSMREREHTKTAELKAEAKMFALHVLEAKVEILLQQVATARAAVPKGEVRYFDQVGIKELLFGRMQENVVISRDIAATVAGIRGLICRRSGYFKEDFPFYRDIKADHCQDVHSSLKLAEEYMMKNNFASAIILLCLLHVLYEDANVRQSCFKAHISGAIQAMDTELLGQRIAKNRLRNALSYPHFMADSHVEQTKILHIFLLSKKNEHSTTTSDRIAKILRHICGLDVAVNTEYPLFDVSMQDDLMRTSFCTAIVEDNEEDTDDGFLEMLDKVKIKLDRSDTNVIVINVNGPALHADLGICPMTSSFPVDEANESDKMKEWIRSFFDTAAKHCLYRTTSD